MKLLFIASKFPCYDETFLLREIRAVRQQGVDVAIFSLKPARDPIVHRDAEELLPLAIYLPFLSLGVLRANARMLWRYPRRYLSTLFRLVAGCWRRPGVLARTLAIFPKTAALAAELRGRDIGHVHALWATHPATAAWILRGLMRVTYSFSGHAHDIYLDTTMLADKIAAAEFVLTCTQHNRKHLESFGPGSKIRVSYHGLDVERFQPAPREPGQPLRLLGVGSLLECKGFTYLVEAVGILARQGKDVRCTIAGGGPLEGALREQAARLEIANRIDFRGYVKQEDMPPLYQQADIFVLPALLEIHWGIPNVLVEAMACELPILVTGLPSVREVLHGDDIGMVLEEKSAEAIARRVSELAIHADDRRRKGRAGREKVLKKFNLEANGKRMAEWFRAYL